MFLRRLLLAKHHETRDGNLHAEPRAFVTRSLWQVDSSFLRDFLIPNRTSESCALAHAGNSLYTLVLHQ